jgi:hypothetical protein
MPTNPQRVVVVSIGRSGTSLISRILHEVLTVDFGEEADHIPRNHNNPDGYFENAEFLTVDQRILAAVGASVLSPPPIDFASHMDARIRSNFVDGCGRLLEKYAANKPAFGWKDPRLSFTLPIWRAACPDITPIIAFRKPESVLASIAAQLDQPVETLAGLWFAYYRHVLTHTDGLNRLFVSFDQLLAEPVTVVRSMAKHLNRQMSNEEIAARLVGIVKPQQSRHSSAENAANAASLLDADTEAVYQYLDQNTRDGRQPDPAQLHALLKL